jgi:hypothetical protein
VTRARHRTDRLAMAVAGLAWIAVARATVSAQPAVSVAAAPRSFTVVTVPVPEDISAQRNVAFRVVPVPPGTVLGSLRGTLPVTPGMARTIHLTLGVPANARPGRATMATVFFEADGRSVEVPVVVTVSATRQLALHFVDSARVVVPGATVPLAVRLTNTGNAADSALLRVVVPTGWTARVADGVAAAYIPFGGIADRIVTVTAPASEAGTGIVRVIAESDGVAVATAETAVTISARRGSVAATGPGLRTTVALASGAHGPVTPAFNADVDGPVSDGISVSARLSSPRVDDIGASYALAGAGLFTAPPSIDLYSRDWRGRFGLSGMTCSDLCGVNVTGRGGQLSAERGAWHATLLAARPYSGTRGGDGELGLARVERQWSAGSWSVAYAKLADRGPAARELEALSLGAAVSGLAGGRFDMEVAQRRFGGSQQFGWRSAFTRRDDQGLFDFRYAYAPGGSRAYARATHDLAASVSRALSRRLSVNGSAWRVSDAAATFRRLTTDGWTMGGVVSLHRGIALSLTGRGNGFSAFGNDGSGFGTREQSVEATLGVRRGSFSLTSMLAEGRVSRETTLDGSTFTTTSPREMLRGTAALEGAAGALVLTGHIERSGPGAGLPPEQWSYGARLDRVPLASLGSGRLQGAVGAQRLRGLPGYQVPVALSGALSLSFPHGERIQLSMERNPFFSAPGQKAGAVFVLSATQVATLPRVAPSGVRGLVYKDMNGNGARDPGEPGMPGVLVHRGSDAAMTDARGWYALGASSGEVSVDPRSVPAGWLVPSSRARSANPDVGLVTLASASVRLRVIASDSDRVSSEDLARVRVQARDASGRVWTARHTEPGVLTFDALPPGAYRLAVDASESREPLFVVGELPDLVIDGIRAPEVRTLVLRARPVRFGPSSRQWGAPSLR